MRHSPPGGSVIAKTRLLEQVSAPIPGVSDYHGPAGGWGALKAVTKALVGQNVLLDGAKTLLRANKPEGFDCPGCAWPDPKHTASVEFCENGAKAVAWESTTKRAGPDFFSVHTLSELSTWSDYELEAEGRLTHPMAYDPSSDRYLTVTWEEAFRDIAAQLKTYDSPDRVEFYASGRASNEAAFLFQLMARAFGTNNFPDCSNMCHEPTSVGLPPAIGVGKGSVSLEDFDHADAIFSFGHNPGTNHPRMMATLRDAAKRGAKIVVFNPMKERSLERFASPQDPVEMATLTSTPIATHYHQVGVGGDAAAVKGIMKAVFALDDASLAEGGEGVLDRAFIAEHTLGLDALRADVEATPWKEIEAESRLTRSALEEAAGVYCKAKAVILCYGMGITQHLSSSSTVRQLANLLMLRGNIGKPGAGICPLRGHSNVQGARTVGVAEKPAAAFLDSMDRVFGITSPRHHGHTVVEAIAALRDGQSKAIICLGGNIAAAAPDPQTTFAALQKADLVVNIATKLNRTHLLHGAEHGGRAWLLPCLGRTELDIQATGEQAITVEDSMAMVHASRGKNPPASEHLRSEPSIVAGIAEALLGKSPIDWSWQVADYDRVRDLIEQVFPDLFTDYNERIRIPGGFRLPLAHAERQWKTATGKANFMVHTPDGPDGVDPRRGQADVLLLTTVRSHDQYNTTIYGPDDRYRGVSARRDVVFVSPADLEARGLKQGDKVDLVAAFPHAGDRERIVRGFTAVAREMPQGSMAAYFPEVNDLVLLDAHDIASGTPAYKSAPVRLRPAQPA